MNDKILFMRLGIPLPHIEYEYGQKLLVGVKEYVEKTGNDFLVFVSKQPKAAETEFAYQEWAVSKFFNNKNLDGLIMPTATLSRFVSEEEMAKMVQEYSKKLPTFSVISEVENVPSLVINSDEVFKNFIRHLIKKHNRKNFAFMGIDCQSGDIALRYKLFREVLAENNIQFDENLLIFGDYTLISAINALQNKFKNKSDINFDAIVCVTDEMAVGAIEFLQHLGLDVPNDVIVTGFDNGLRASYNFPSLSTVDQLVAMQAFKSACLLEDMVNKKNVPLLTTIQPVCCFRASCGCLQKNESRYACVDEFGNYTLKDENFFNIVSTNFFDRHDQTIKMLDFVEELQSNLSLERLATRLERHLLDFEIEHCAICLYEKPALVLPNEEYDLPNQARLYYLRSQNQEKAIIDEQKYFNCKQSLLPNNLLEQFKGIQIVKMLYHGELQYGYLIIPFGLFDCAVYQLIFSLLSKFIASAYEITMSEQQKSNLEQRNLNLSILSKTDELTGILNRRGFLYAAQQQLNIAAEIEQKGLVIYGDIDGLKYINDTFGHDAGDRAILAEVELLSKAFRSTDIIGRLGGDEFAILSISLNFEIFEKIKIRLENLCKEWNDSVDEPFTLSISLGAAEFDKDNFDLVELLKQADNEQYKEKRSKKACRK